MLPSENPVAVTKFFRSPRTGLEPVPSWLTVTRSTDWTTGEYLTLIGGLTSHAHIKLVLFNRKEQTVKRNGKDSIFSFSSKKGVRPICSPKNYRQLVASKFSFWGRKNLNKLSGGGGWTRTNEALRSGFTARSHCR